MDVVNELPIMSCQTIDSIHFFIRNNVIFVVTPSALQRKFEDGTIFEMLCFYIQIIYVFTYFAICELLYPFYLFVYRTLLIDGYHIPIIIILLFASYIYFAYVFFIHIPLYMSCLPTCLHPRYTCFVDVNLNK